MSRIDHRSYNQLRPIKFTPDFTSYAEGSVLIETGQTRVLCNVTIEDQVPRWREVSGGGWVTAEYGMLPRSTHRRVDRKHIVSDHEIRLGRGRAHASHPVQLLF